MRTADVDCRRGRRLGSRRTAVSAGLVATLLIVAVSSTWVFAQPEEKPADEDRPGLRGIWPAEVPDDLVFEEIQTLGGNWTQWSEELADDVNRLYDIEDRSAAEQREVIAALRKRLATMQRALADRRYRAIHDRLITLHGRIDRRVDLAEAILDTLELDPEAAKTARLAPLRREVASAVRELEAYLNRVRNGLPWIGYLRTAELTRAMRAGEPAPAALRDVQLRFDQGDKLENADQREFINRPPFQRLRRAVDALVAAEAAPVEIDEQKVRDELGRLIEAIEGWEQEGLARHAREARDAYESLRRLLPDRGGRLMETLRADYLNYNFQLIASEQFMNRLYREQRVEAEPVRDQVMGASVVGTQVTTTDADVDLKPSADGALFDIVARGTTQSSTTAYARQATVLASGLHRFQVSRGVRFDGERFVPITPPRVGVNASVNPYAARTRHSGWPIIGHIADSIALNAARRRRGQSEATARQRISSRVYTEFERETNRDLAEANRDLDQQWHRKLADHGMTPNARKVRSTDEYLLMSSRVMDFGEIGGSIPNRSLLGGPGVTVRVHETLLNRWFDQMEFAGRTMTDAEIRQELEQNFSDFFGQEIEILPAKEAEPRKDEDQFMFHKTDPIRFQIEDDRVYLILRAGLRRKGEEDIPPQVMTVPLTFAFRGNQLLINRGNVRVAPLDVPESRAKQIVRAGIIRKKIEESIEDRTRSRYVKIERENRPPVWVRITRIKSLNGWLTVWGE